MQKPFPNTQERQQQVAQQGQGQGPGGSVRIVTPLMVKIPLDEMLQHVRRKSVIPISPDVLSELSKHRSFDDPPPGGAR